MTSQTEATRFLPHGALAVQAKGIQGTPELASLTAAIEDQSQSVFGDIFWAIKSWIINLGAVSIATHLKGLGVGTVDAFYPVMKGTRISKRYDLVGLSCSEVSVATTTGRLKELRDAYGEQPLVLVGGPGMDHWWQCLLDNGADAVVLGDGQFPLTQLLGVLLPLMKGGGVTLRRAFLQARENGSLEGVKDLAFVGRDGKAQRTTPQGFVRDLDEYPSVDYGLIRGYVRQHIKCVHHSSGCVFNCEFCSSIVNQRHCYRQVSAERLLQDMEQAQREGYSELFLSSDLLLPGSTAANKRMLLELARERKARGITIRMSSQTTVASLHNLLFTNVGTKDAPRWEEDAEGIAALVGSGAYRWSLGVEAFSHEERARLGKDPRQGSSDAVRTLDGLFRHGMVVHAMMMVHEDTKVERAEEIGRILGDVGVTSVQFFHPVPAPQTPWGAVMFDRRDFLIAEVAGEKTGASRCTGEYVVAANNPQNAVLAVETCWDSFTSVRNIAKDLVRGRVENAAFKVGIRFLVFARRYLMPQYYRYLAGVLNGDFKYFVPGDALHPGTSLSAVGSFRPDLRMWGLLKRQRRLVERAAARPTQQAGELVGPTQS